MNMTFTLKAALIVAAMLLLPLAQAATMAKADYKADKAACASFTDNAKTNCIAAANAKFGKN